MSDLFRKVIPGRKAGDTPASPGDIPVAGLSIFSPIFLGIDENGCAVYIELPDRNMLCAGEPGSGKSVLLSGIIGHGALCTDVRLVLIDGKEVELGMWRDIADVFVGMDHKRVLTVLRDLQIQMDHRYDWLATNRRRKILRKDNIPFVLLVIDEMALFSSTYGTKTDQEEFVRLLRDLVARGRAAGIIVIAATQRPSADIVPTSLRDIFGYRVAFRCTTEASSDIILGTGWAKQGYDATTIDPDSRGVGWLLAEGGFPRRFKSAYLSDADIDWLIDRASWVRRGGEAA